MLNTIGRYEILEKLGEGGMAVVYKARDPNMNRTVALKVLLDTYNDNPEYRKRFLREAKAVGTLSHKHIVTIYDVLEHNNLPCIAMELLEAKTLDEVMAASKRLPLENVIDIGIQLADALDYAHARGIVHRDITPKNIFYFPTENIIKIADFGIAHIEETEESDKTKFGTILGTVHYMSPEQMEATKPIDGRSDLFAVGVILYQLLTGEKPFTGNTLMAIYTQIVRNERKPIADLAPNTPVALIKIVEKLLDKDREQRFQSGGELSEALQRVRHHLHQRESRVKSLASPAASQKWIILTAIIIGATLIIGFVMIYERQYKAMTHLIFELGSSLSQLIATENAETVLLEDWIGIQTMVEKLSTNPSIHYLIITDHNHLIRGSTENALIGQPYKKINDATLLAKIGDTKIFKKELSGATIIYHFETPIVFQQTEIGRSYLGLPQTPLQKVANSTILIMIIQIAITLIIVAIVGYIIATRFLVRYNSLKSNHFPV